MLPTPKPKFMVLRPISGIYLSPVSTAEHYTDIRLPRADIVTSSAIAEGSARRAKSVEMLSTAAQLYEKSHLKWRLQ